VRAAVLARHARMSAGARRQALTGAGRTDDNGLRSEPVSLGASPVQRIV
jgi:hypothetical protein